MKKRIISLCLAMIMLCAILPKMQIETKAYSEAYPLPELTGKTAIDVAEIAKSQVGYRYNNGTVYGAWWNGITNWGYDYTRVSWCGIFACWCAYHAGAGMNVSFDKNGALAELLFAWLKSNAAYDMTFSTAPKVGDFIFFGNSSGYAEHAAIVTGYDPATNIVTFVGGNQGGAVTSDTCQWRHDYLWGSQYVLGYGRPNYCSHTYNEIGICSACDNVYEWQARFDADCAGDYTVSLAGGIYLHTDKPYSASTANMELIQEGTKVAVLGSVKNHYQQQWYKVSYNGVVGYTLADNLKPVPHVCYKGTYLYSEKEHPHRSCYECSICGEIWAEDGSKNFHASCAECKKAEGYETAWFPAQQMCLTQIAYESHSHGAQNAIDIAPGGDVFAPFTGTIVYKDNNWGYVVFQSVDKVYYADGTLDYMTVAFMHDEDIDDLNVGQVINQGVGFYQAGGMGNGNADTYGDHVHISVHKGQSAGITDTGEYGSGDVYAYEAFLVNTNKTTSVVNQGVMAPENYMNSGAPSNWNGLWKGLQSVKPGKPVLQQTILNSKVIFTWDATENTTHYDLLLERKTSSGKWVPVEQIFYARSGLARELDDGEYRAQLVSYNSNAYESDGSDWLHTQAEIVLFAIGEEITITYYNSAGEVWLTEKCVSSADHSLPKNYPTCTDGYFSGWAYTKNAQEWAIRPEEAFKASNDISLYPVYVSYSDAVSGEAVQIYNIADFTHTGYDIEAVEVTVQRMETVGRWTDWSAYTIDKVSASDTVEVRTATLYRYYYFLCPNCGGREPFWGTSVCGASLPHATWHEGWFATPYMQSNYQTYSHTAEKYYTESLGDGQIWNFSSGNLYDTAVGTIDSDSDKVVIAKGYSSRTYVEQPETVEKTVAAYKIKTKEPIRPDAIEGEYAEEINLWLKIFVPDSFQGNEKASLVMTKQGGYGVETVTIKGSELGNADAKGRYLLKMGIASGEMTSKVTYEFYDANGNKMDIITSSGNNMGNTATFSLLNYARSMLRTGTDAQKKMVEAMLTYGGYAQKYFGVDAQNPAYNLLTQLGMAVPSLDGVTADRITDSTVVVDGQNGIKATGMQAFLDSAIYLRVYFNLAEGADIKDYKLVLTYADPEGNTHTKEVEPGYEAGRNRYYVDIEDIPAAYLDYMYNITVTNTKTNATYSVTTSVIVWVKNSLNSSSNEDQKNLLKAIYLYNQAANELFGK